MKLHWKCTLYLSYQVRHIYEEHACLDTKPQFSNCQIMSIIIFMFWAQCLECRPSELNPLVGKQTSKVVWANYPIYVTFFSSFNLSLVNSRWSIDISIWQLLNSIFSFPPRSFSKYKFRDFSIRVIVRITGIIKFSTAVCNSQKAEVLNQCFIGRVGGNKNNN